MRNGKSTWGVLLGWMLLSSVNGIRAQDWPQWRGPHRDAKVTGFKAPKTWPKELTQKWKVTVGEGVASPALVGDKLYVFTRQEENEVLSCLDAATGKEQWQDKYQAEAVRGAASSFPGPRSSPAVAEGKVVTLGVSGTLSCYDAATGKRVWRKDDIRSHPRFFASSSPIIVNGLCIAQLGGENEGALVAYDLAGGNQKWKWTGSTAYSSPVLLTVAGIQMIVAETSESIVGVAVSDGKLLWETPFAVRGRGYNASTPLVAGQTIIFSGSNRGTRAMKIEKQDGQFAAKELWHNEDSSVQFNTPVLKNGLIFGLSDRDQLFCLHADTGKTAWSAPLSSGGGGGGRRGRSGYGSIVDAGPVLFAMTPTSGLVVLEPSAKEFKQLAHYTVSDSPVYAYPVIAGNRIFVKDSDSVILWTID